MTTYRIAEVAERSGFPPATLRYYEEIGLVRPVGRTGAGYRLYDDASLQRLRFVARAKQLGCSLEEIAELSAAWDGGRCAHVQERLRAAVEAKVTESRRRIAELTVLTAELQRAAAGLRVSATGACDDTCGCLAEPPNGKREVQAVPLVAAPEPPEASGPGLPDPGCGDAGCACGPEAAEAVDTDPPIACTLEPDRMGRRLEEWASVLGPDRDGRPGVVARSAVDGGVRLLFGPGTDVREVARLAAAEQDCCRFFRFDLSIDTRGVALEVRAPAGAADVVTALFGAPA